MRFLLMTSVVRIWFMRIFARPKKTHEPRTRCMTVSEVMPDDILFLISTVSSSQQKSIQNPDKSCFSQLQFLFSHISSVLAFSSSQQSKLLHFAKVAIFLRQSPPSFPYFVEFINWLHLPSPQQ